MDAASHLPWFKSARVAGLLAGVALLVVGLMFLKRPSDPVPATERTIAELERRDGALFEKGAPERFTGWMVEHQADGGLKSRSWIAQGVLNGVSEGWYTNGVLQIREHFVEGASQGLVTRWRPDGTKVSEGTAERGKLEGVFRRWHPNGQLAEEVTLQTGEPHGLGRAWFPSGSLKSEVEMDHGKVLSQRFWKDGENPDRSVAAAPVQQP
jgi:antitoxin component YwqK of YwqJK toxin-antitoxin module